MADYTRRIVDDELDELSPELAALAIEGPKAVGKTATSERRAATVHRLDVPEVRSIAAADPTVLLRHPPPVLLDEWQHVPAIWDAVRAAVDRDPAPGRFLLAGSATSTKPPSHSGAGRIVRVRMRPLSLFERGLGEPPVSLAALLRGSKSKAEGHTRLGLADYAHEIVASGFPAIRRLSGRALRAQLDGYLERIVERDFQEQGYTVRRPQALHRWMAAFAAATATTPSEERARTSFGQKHGGMVCVTIRAMSPLSSETRKSAILLRSTSRFTTMMWSTPPWLCATRISEPNRYPRHRRTTLGTTSRPATTACAVTCPTMQSSVSLLAGKRRTASDQKRGFSIRGIVTPSRWSGRGD